MAAVMDIYQVFDEKLGDLIKLVEEDRFPGALYTANDLTRISVLSKFERGVLIGEVLDGIFREMGHMFERHAVPDVRKSDIRGTIIQGLVKIRSVYNDEGSSGIYGALEGIRYAATAFQIGQLSSESSFGDMRMPPRPAE